MAFDIVELSPAYDTNGKSLASKRRPFVWI